MKYVGEFLIVLVLLFVQTRFGTAFVIWGIKPDLLLIYLCHRAYVDGPIHGSILGFLIGLFQGVYSPASLGADSLAKTVVGFAMGRSREAIYHNDIAMRLVSVFVAVLSHDLIFFLFTDPASIVQNFFRVSLLTAAYTVMLAGSIHLIAHGVEKLLSD